MPTIDGDACPVDTFYFPLMNVCAACPDVHSSSLGQRGVRSCRCSAGYREEGYAETLKCIACDAGSYAPVGSPRCLLCNAGSYSSRISSSCSLCAAGFTSLNGSATGKMNVPRGTTRTTQDHRCVRHVRRVMRMVQEVKQLVRFVHKEPTAMRWVAVNVTRVQLARSHRRWGQRPHLIV